LSSFVSARKPVKDVALSYKTALKAFDLLRRVLVEDLTRSDALWKEEPEADEFYYGGRRKGKKVLVPGFQSPKTSSSGVFEN
jgi:hypothetical protein